MQARFIALLLLFLAPLHVLAIVEQFSASIQGAQITTAGAPQLALSDNQYATMVANPTTWQSTFAHKTVTNRVRLGINPNVLQTNALSGNISLQIKAWTWDSGTNAFVTSTVTRTLAVNYSMTPTDIIDEAATYAFTGAHRIEVTILSIDPGIDVNDVYIRAEIDVERYYTFNGIAPLSPLAAVSGQYVNFSWSAVQGAEFYELEWVHINDYKALNETSAIPANELNYNFYRNSTRVVIRASQYSIPKLFDRGYLLFRVRAIGLTGADYTMRQEGSWTMAESGLVSGLTVNSNYLYFTDWADEDMNWSHQVAYTEDGKRFEGVAFADGFGRPHQSLGHNTETGQVIVSNTYYDGFGRPVISDLPTPVDSEDLTHRPNFNHAEGASFYDAEHFSQVYLENSPSCSFETMPFDIDYGAGKYYSENNPDRDGENARIPDAEQYPFARIEYMEDHTGRIRRVGSAGADFQVGSGHETEFYYSTPTQEELDRLFGSEAGYSEHYQKRITVDANDQLYIEYFDMAGRIVASGLAGKAPDNLDTLSNNSILNTTQTISEGTQGEVTATAMILTQPLNITVDETYAFDYDLNPSQFTAATCMPGICFDCAYILTVKITKEACGDTLYGDTLHINGGEYDAICNGTYPFAEAFEVYLPKGNYIFTKTLTIDQGAINAYWCTYLENNACIPTFAELFNERYLNADFDACDRIAEEDTTGNHPCETLRAIMLHDVSPGGQYAQYTVSGTIYSAPSQISVLYTDGSSYLSGDWKNPSGGHYPDALGNTAYVTVTPVGGGNFQPPVTVTPAFSGGIYTVEPHQLANLSDFVLLFEDSWANALLPYHPEYCYLQYCESNDEVYDYELETSSITTFDVACAGGYFAPLGGSVAVSGQVTTFTDCDTAAYTDPYFVSGTTNYTTMQNKLTNYITIGGLNLSMIDYAIMQVACPDLTTSTAINSCLRNNSNACNLDAVWLLFRELYMAEKAKIYAESEAAYIATAQCAPVVEMIGDPSPPNPFSDCTPRWGFLEDAMNTDYSDPANDPFATATAQAASVCAIVAEGYVEQWLSQLANCPTIAALDSTERADLRSDLIALAVYGCSDDHAACATTLPPGASLVLPAPNGGTLTGGDGINDVLALHIAGFTESDLCTELLISDPGPYREDLSEDVHLDTCGCDLLLATEAEFTGGTLPAGVTTIEQLLAHNTGLSLEDIDALVCQCKDIAGSWTENYDWSPSEQTSILALNAIVPQQLTCDECVQCTDVQQAQTDLITRFGSGLKESANYPAILTNYCNNTFGFTLTDHDYQNFLQQCNADAGNPYCAPADELISFRDVLNLLAHGGQLTSASTLDLVNKNIVYKHSALYDYLGATHYSAAVSGSSLQLTFKENGTTLPCSTALQLPDSAAFDFTDIVSFGDISVTGGSCEENANTFEVEIAYYDCGELVTALLTGYTDCFPVQNCYCGGDITLCNETVGEQFIDETPCYEPLLSQLYQETQEAYDEAVLAAHAAFAAEYNSVCSAAFATEAITYTGPVNNYQYTLFYYDQAGNLVQTVAPKGVTPLVSTAAAKASREGTTGIGDQETAVLPGHDFKTTYAYNSYDQPVSTTNPDQDGATKYWYDRYGRIAASQNPVQKDDNKYSYVLYDPQGRPVEVGQADRDFSPGVQRLPISENDLKADDKGASFKSWVYSCARTEVTLTVYDKPYSPAAAAKFAGNVQQNLRLRVAAVLYYPTVALGAAPTTGYESATHYSYDVHGNVIETLQDVPLMAPVETDIVSTRYEFELISGNVKTVDYQKERWDTGTSTWKTRRDRLTHEYTYDQLNRLTEVYTSTDNGVHKVREARYRYFDYGPLARVEIGQHDVQGNDFSYTINGWLKAMNGTTLDRQRDGGKDGGSGYLTASPDIHKLFAPDITGYTLGYYNGDYRSIGATSFEAAVGTGNAMSNALRSLYNGNIAWTTQAIDGYETKAGVYVYDQLQRLKAMRIFHSSQLQATNNWNGSIETAEYSSAYSYDANGNLQTLVRKGTASIALDMDDFTYNYMLGANRLTHVTDADGATPGYNADINDGQLGTAGQPITASQTGNNYQYDKLGQLVKDVQEGNTTLTWRYGDKKLRSQQSATKRLEFIYNPMGQRVVKIEKAVSGGNVVDQSTIPWIYSYYAYDANGQVMSTYAIAMNEQAEEVRIDEQLLYGSGRIGVIQSGELIWSGEEELPAETDVWTNQTGRRRYELTNHLGNVNAVITDRKMVSPDYALRVFENYNSSTASWSTSSSCGTPIPTVSGGQLTVTHDCAFRIHRNVTIAANTEYTFSADIVDRSAIEGMAIELYVALNGTSTYNYLVPMFVTVPNGNFSYTFTTPANATSLRYAFRKTSGETGAGFTIDNLYLGTTAAQYAAVPVQQMDYYPYGMEMTGGIEIGSIPASITGSGTITEEPVIYTNRYNTFINDDGDLQLTAASSTTPLENSANSVQQVLPGEYIEFTAPPDPVATNRMFIGLSYQDGGFLYTSINYCWYLYPDGRQFALQNGTTVFSYNPVYVPGTTKFRISRTGGTIVYSRNGVVMHTVADANPNQPMIVDITMWETGTPDTARVHNLVVGKLDYAVATYAIGDYVPYVHSDYRFGYNGMEQDPETKGQGNHYTTEFRQYDPRLGRWMSRDDLESQKANLSPYQSFKNNPVLFVDPDGRDEHLSIVVTDQRTNITYTVRLGKISDKIRAGKIIDRPHLEDKQNYYDFRTIYWVTIAKDGSQTIKKTYWDLSVIPVYTDYCYFCNDEGEIVDPNAKGWDLTGKGEHQKSGMTLTTESGGASPTRTRPLTGGEQNDIGDWLENLPGGGSLGNSKADALKDIIGMFEKEEEIRKMKKDQATVEKDVSEAKHYTPEDPVVVIERDENSDGSIRETRSTQSRSEAGTYRGKWNKNRDTIVTDVRKYNKDGN